MGGWGCCNCVGVHGMSIPLLTIASFDPHGIGESCSAPCDSYWSFAQPCNKIWYIGVLLAVLLLLQMSMYVPPK